MGRLFKVCVYNVLNFLAWAFIVGSFNLLQILDPIEQAIRRTVARWFKRRK